MDPISIARAAASSINKRIRSAPEFDAILPINDYSREVRSCVVKGATIAAIATNTNTSITQKGRFHGLGELEIPAGEKELHLLVEGHTFMEVEIAMRKLGEWLPGGGMSFSGGGGGRGKVLLKSSGPTFRLALPGLRCFCCNVEFWTVEDAREHFDRDNAALL